MSQQKAMIDKLLTDVSQMYTPPGLIADQVLPVISVKQKTGKLGKYGKDHLRLEHSLAGGKAAYKRVSPIVRSTDSYEVESHGLEGIVTEDDYDNVEQPFDAEQDETLGLKSLIAINKELAFATAFTDSAVLTQNTTLSGTSQLSDYANSDPIGVFKAARLAVYDGCGLAPNMGIMDWSVANTLAYHPGILDALGFTMNRAGQLSEAELAKALGLDKLIIAQGKYNSSKKGQADSMVNIWGKHIVMYYAPAKAAKYQTSLGYKIELAGRGSNRVSKYAINNPPNSTGILVDDSYDVMLTDVTAAYLIKNAIA